VNVITTAIAASSPSRGLPQCSLPPYRRHHPGSVPSGKRVEVYVGDEFIGVIFRDEEDGELSYDFSMAILDFDLE
jgi:uncharacterized protein DUF3126